ncbi:hypothetical protein BJN34_27500 [Cupriavidus necator]|uniref:Uncharacterized protein n=1 Tax=Cupriavidus necator TaxID=106590 RepID=A0A1U9UY71_CUPNE|nr:hypothetical protein [Cupriavidus necator]AQV97612.1 hypothetical protein BJN34_27500 [Cupriavidus necator]
MTFRPSILARPHWLAALLLSAALAACGGDSGESPSASPAAAPTTPGVPGTGGNPGQGNGSDRPGETPATKPQLRCAP